MCYARHVDRIRGGRVKKCLEINHLMALESEASATIKPAAQKQHTELQKKLHGVSRLKNL